MPAPRPARHLPRWAREPDHGLSQTWTEVDGRPVRSLSTGTVRELPEVVLLPGLGAPFYLLPWVRELARWTRVTVLDLPGFTGGRAASSPSTVEGVAGVAARWLEETGRSGVVLAGHSSGAQSALRTAVLVPARISGVVLGGPTVEPRARRPLRLLVRLVRTLSGEVLPELRAVAPSYLGSGGLALLRLIWSTLRDRPEDVAPRVAHPVLVVTGEADRLASPEWSQHLAALAGGRCVPVPGAHNACFTFPRELDAVVHRTVQAWHAEHRSA
ncbi:alpha/beta fold hydrolase [Auraticoccus sp. F435]|uniref:Alpha/beta fold hydrolase n=1 Tax=Auraticoccus cholistanensis TaxID=2656650 RepID=A0A6A9UY53_9ACTN|nr:alpha/beta fold hydrolase [Auraticoccus cholistanensis]